ncbi:MAG: DnaD domain protein [Chloroflexi bacterium]|nr:DnaD domain protein [Chloroflexota bacterium]
MSESVAARTFEGFRTGQRATTLPVQFFTELLETIDDPDELRVTLYALYAIPKPGRPHALRASALAAEAPLARHYGERAVEVVERAVALAAERGTLLTLGLDDPTGGDVLVFVNNESGRRLMERIANGLEDAPGGGRVVARSAVRPEGLAAVYEAEIGMLSPSVAAALGEAEQAYPSAWVADALREAARQNKRSWSYAEAILRRWKSEGRTDETAEGHPGRAGRTDPYEHLYRRD